MGGRLGTLWTGKLGRTALAGAQKGRKRSHRLWTCERNRQKELKYLTCWVDAACSSLTFLEARGPNTAQPGH